AEIPPLLDGPEYAADVDAWHARRVENLRSKTGWLTLIGLFWLQEGDNTFGSAGDNTLAFPEKAPARAGTLRLEAGKVTVTAAPEAPLLHDGEPVDVLELASDAGGEPTILDLGSLRFYVIDREGRLGIRLKDSESATLESFAGIDRFPVEPAWRFEARWEAYDPPQTVFTPNVLGSAFEEECPGALVLTINGEEHRLEPTSAGEGNLFLVFGDATNGDSTYGGGRFLELGPPANGKVLVDFNRAYNPPCVFTPYATCPLPRRENRLPVEIPAGEKMWGEGHHDT
ncbi:MAG: DUF1684 domain-containing protein, partial [Acidobacteria bacterium]|nr:DUF1684 domain-containing protein [Acidobacteriota bacterium]